MQLALVPGGNLGTRVDAKLAQDVGHVKRSRLTFAGAPLRLCGMRRIMTKVLSLRRNLDKGLQRRWNL